MKCSDLQSNLGLYVDGFVDGDDRDLFAGHLSVCPLCRESYADHRRLAKDLRSLRRPEIGLALQDSIKRSVRSEIRSEKNSWLAGSTDLREWLQMQVMPYGVGVMASILVGMTFLTMMFSGMLKPGDLPITLNGERSVMLASNPEPYKNPDSSSISPTEYAKTRLGFASTSPSVNPQGALVALTKSLIRGGMKDDEVVVVADVFGNGLAQIAEVVEPSRDRRAVGELEKALESDPAFSPFIPSTIEGRPDSVRVILKFQSVDVSTRKKRHR